MCGIAGMFHYGDLNRKIDPSTLDRMTDILAHRGPDGRGVYLDGAIGLGHRRLAILDLSETGAQPMVSSDRKSVLVYNGETYNHRQLRQEFLDSGHSFRGTSDTETILHLLQRHGAAALSRLIGIFGLAFWNASSRTLLLARDPLGVKQLYYHDDGSTIRFASEIKSLLTCPEVPRSLNPEGFNEYVHFYTPLFDHTFFRDIQQVKPGEYLVVKPSGIVRETYWQIDDFGVNHYAMDEAIDHLRGSLEQVVGDQLMADVPVGAFFSGGIDSSAVASFAKRNGKKPLLFGVHFSDQGVIDERPYQEEAARALDLELHLTTVDSNQFPTDLPKLLYYQDCPVIGPALLPMFQVSKLAREHVKVCLGGQGADEIFAGYARYGLTQPWSTFVGLLRAKLGKRATSNPASAQNDVRGNLWKQVLDARNFRRLVGTARHLFDWQTRYFDTFALIPEPLWNSVLGDRSLVSRSRCYDAFRSTVARSGAADAPTKALHWDLQTWLPGLFHQDDRMSMANSLESRVPLADPRLVKFAFQCDFGLKFRHGASKWLLRQAVADVLPENVLNRRKVGFDTPTKSWMQGPHFNFVRDTLLSQRARERGWWNAAELSKFLDNRAHPLWHDVVWRVLCVETWAQVFLDGAHFSHGRFDATASAVPKAA